MSSTTEVRYVGPHDAASTEWGEVANGDTLTVPTDAAKALSETTNFEPAATNGKPAKTQTTKSPAETNPDPAADGQED